MSNKECVYKSQVINVFLSILEIASSDVKHSLSFEKDFQKRLKFQNINGWKKFRACVDLLEDTEYALFSFFQYQLGDLKNNNNDFGELNIRLYGVLNAVYLQISAFEVISTLINFPERNDLKKKYFEHLDIYKLRGMAGSHTVNYCYDKEILEKNPKISKVTSFRITQVHLEKTGKKIYLLDENNLKYEFNLLDCLLEYEEVARNLLIQMIKHSISCLVFKKEQKKALNIHLNSLLINLIDYRKVNENDVYFKKKLASIKKRVSTKLKKSV